MFKYNFFSVILQLSVTVTLLYFPEKHITYLNEIKEENSSNIFLITVNEKLYFAIWTTFQLPPQKLILDWCLKVISRWYLFLKQTTNTLSGSICDMWYFMKFVCEKSFLIKTLSFSKIRIHIETYYSWILDRYVSWISKHKYP